MKKSWIKGSSLALACLLGLGSLATSLVIISKQQKTSTSVDAATTTTATLTYNDVFANARSDYKKTVWGDWQWWKVPKSNGEIYAGENTYFVNNKAYSDGATKIDFSISFKDGYVVPRIEMVATTLATNSNSFSWTIAEEYYNENPPYKVYLNDPNSGERHIIQSLTVTYTFTKYKITLNSNGGTGGLSSVQTPYNRAMPTIASSNLPTRSGYNFLGYFDTSASTGGNKYYNANGTSAKTFTNKNDSLVLYARWELAQKAVNITKGTGLNNVYVSSNGNVSDGSSADLKASGTNFAQGSTVYGYVKLAKGYQAQNGWTLKSGTANTEDALYLIGSGTVSSSGYDFGTINASLITYSIDYELNGGSLEDANPTSYTVESDTFSLNNPTKEGYNFLGWSLDGQSGYSETVTITKGTIGNKKYTANWALVDELQTVVNAINNLGGPTSISYPGSKTDLEYAESLYGALSPELKTILDSDYGDLVNELAQDRETYNSLRTAAIDGTIAKISAIGEVVYTEECKNKIDEARTSNDALYLDDQSLITNYQDLLDAEATYALLKADHDAAEAVEDLINAIPSPVELTSEEAIVTARNAYENLTDAQKELVTNYEALTDAEAALQALKDQQVADVVTEKINALGLITLDKENDVIAAREAYEALNEEQKAYVSADVLATLEAAEQRILDLKAAKDKADEVVVKINDIGEVTYPGSGDSIKAARDAYDALTSDDERGFVTNYNDLLSAEQTYEQLKEQGANDAKFLIDGIGEIEDTNECKAKIEAARDAYDALTDEQKALIDPEARLALEKAEADYAALHNRNEADKVQNVINAIGDVMYNKESKDKIDDARAAYDALDDAAKALVANYQTLLDAEAMFKHVDDAVNKINAIGEVTLQSGEAIEEARAAYDALSDKERELFPYNEYNVLTEAEAKYDELQADANKALGWAIALIIIAIIVIALPFVLIGLQLLLFLILALAWVFMMFVFNRWIKEEDKAVRACNLFGIKKKDGKRFLIVFPLKFDSRLDNEIFKKKEDALK